MKPWLNPSKAFSDSARKTDPFVKGFPKNVREAFDITDVNAEGIFKIEISTIRKRIKVKRTAFCWN